MEKEIIDSIVKEVSKHMSGGTPQPVPAAERLGGQRTAPRQVPVGVSNRHLHLSSEHMQYLLGEKYQLENMRDLLQPCQFASTLTVTLIGAKGFLQNVRVLGPCRGRTQVEISRTDSFTLGLKPPVRISGDINGSCGCLIYANGRTVKLDEGVIIAARHLHLAPDEAGRLGLKNGDSIKVRTTGTRSTIFENVAVRAGKEHRMELHLDTDEANAAGLSNGDMVEIV